MDAAFKPAPALVNLSASGYALDGGLSHSGVVGRLVYYAGRMLFHVLCQLMYGAPWAWRMVHHVKDKELTKRF